MLQTSMPDKTIKYPAKLLLLGEYTILNSQLGLATPLEKFSGFLKMGKVNTESNLVFKMMGPFLGNLNLPGFKEELFFADIEQGLSFESTIPEGYGVGSSAAVSAAIYDQYFNKEGDNLRSHQPILSAIESFFHGKSSGIDPLVSYSNKGVFKGPQNKVMGIRLYGVEHHFFLVDTKQRRETPGLVTNYLRRYESEPSFAVAMEELSSYVRAGIKNVMRKDEVDNDSEKELFEIIKQISKLQFDNMKDVIPETHLAFWEKSLSSSLYSIKLNGAGGGGFLLGYTNDIGQVEKEIEIIRL